MHSTPMGLRALWLLCGLLPVAAGPSPVAAAPDRSDVRVLIDVSGSMRQNDPGNLRRPALRMLAGLLQPGTRAGVWTFAQRVDNLVPVGEVDDAWKQRTRSLSDRIGSPGQFTHIEEVLDQASRDWSGAPGKHARHLLLLTDGMVDVSKDPLESAQSRARILEGLLPRLQAADVKVHTVALSERADHELLERLAAETGGWYQQVDRADELQRVFLRMFETVGQPDALPLEDNRFTVDGSIDEATVLVFTRVGGAPVELYSPAGETFTDSDLPAGVAWFRDQGYELITISSPQKGEWSLRADSDPDNRVMVVTDLKLQTSEIPGHLAVGEEAAVEAFLTSRGKVVDRQAFLRLLDVHAEAQTADGSEERALNDAGVDGDAQAADGRYTLRYLEPRARGSVELLIAVDSPTFMRERRLRLAVREPIRAAVEASEPGPRLAVHTEAAVMQAGAEVDAWQQDVDGQRTPLDLAEVAPGEWEATLVDPRAPTYVSVAGRTRLDNAVVRMLGPLMPPGIAPPAASVERSPLAVPEPAVAEQVVALAVEPAADTAAAAEDPHDGGWLVPLLLFGAFNLALAVAGAIWLLRRRRGSPDAAGETDLVDLIDEQAVDPPEREAAA